MESTAPIVSVIVATRDRPATLPDTLRSIASQTFEDFEVIVVDDGSSEKTLAEYEAIFSGLDDRFRVERPPAPTPWGSGPGVARNRGIHAARGRYLAFCDDDDVWIRDDHLAVAVAALDKTGAEFFFASQRSEKAGEVVEPMWFNTNEAMIREPRVMDDPPVHRVRLEATLSELRFPHLNICVMRHAFVLELGGFWERLRYLEDWDLTFRIFDRAQLSLYRPENVALHNVPTQKGSASRAVSDLERYQITVLAAQHLRIHCSNPYLRKIAGEWEAMYQWRIARWVMEDGRPDAALKIIAQAALAMPSLRWAPFAGKALTATVKKRFRG